MMRMSLSEKEVSQIHLMLTTLPLPPIPITLKLDTATLADGDTKMALDMALAPVMQDLHTHDGIVNSHSVFAAMSFFLKWSAHGSDADTQAKVVHAKDGALLMLIEKVIQYHCTHPQTSTYADADILDIFVKVSQAWIASYLPPGATCVVGPAPKQENIGYEDNLHIAMTHYCYAQGVLYNAKNKRVYCATHEQLCETFRQRCKAEAGERGSDDADVDAQYAEKEHLEVAQLYSQFSYHKLLVLCFNRLLKDSLHGHTYTNGDDNKQELEKNAKDLLRLSYENYKALLCPQPAADAVASATPATTAPVSTGLTPLDEENETALTVSSGEPITGADTNDSTQSVSDVPDPETPDVAIPALEGPLGVVGVGEFVGETATRETKETELGGGAPSLQRPPGEEEVREILLDVGVVNIDDSASEGGVEAVRNGKLTVTYNRSSADSTPLDAASGPQEPFGGKTHSVNPRDLGGYKSIFGIFILETAAFIDNDSDPRLIHNMCTNLRHLNELLQQECAVTQKAVSVIDIPRLIAELRKTSNTPPDIERQLLELEATLLEKGVSCT